MPARLIRDGLLESESVLSLPVEARWLYVSILLSADDVGLFEATPFRLARRADIRRELADRLLEMLADADLVRLYQVDGKAYGFVPRYGQRVQVKRARCPIPPLQLLHGDQDAINKINNLTSNPTVDHGCTTVGHGKTPPEPEPEEIQTPSLRSGVVGGADSASKSPPAPKRAEPPPIDAIVLAYCEALPELPQPRVMNDKRKRAIAKWWQWVMTSKRTDGTRRAETQEQGLAFAKAYFNRVRGSDFLMGTNPRPGAHESWTATLDWLMTDAGVVHVIERTKAPA